VGAITGIAFGVFAAGVLIAVAYFLFLHHEKEKEQDNETGIDTTPNVVAVTPRGMPNHGITPITESTINPMALQQMAPPAPDQEEGLESTNKIKSFAKGNGITRESDVVPAQSPSVPPRDSIAAASRKKSFLSSMADGILGGSVPDPNTPSAEPSASDMAEEAEEGDDISPMHESAYGGQNFSRPLPSKAQRTASILARRDTIPADAMANAAAEATAGIIPAAGSGAKDDALPPAAPDVPGAGSGGLSRANFFKKKEGASMAKEADRGSVTEAPENLEEL
jgi:hypothetical protein